MLRKVYSVDVKVYATAYIVAKSLAEAKRIAKGLPDDGIDCEDREQIGGEQFDSPSLPDISYSPAMTVASKQDRGWLGGLSLSDECEVEWP